MRRVSAIVSSFVLVAGLSGCFLMKKSGVKAPSAVSSSGGSSGVAAADPAADAQPEWQAKSSLNYSKDNLTNHCPLDKRAEDVSRCKQVLDAARKSLGDIHPIHRGMALYAEVAKYADRVEKLIPAWEKELASSAAERKEQDRLREEFRNDTRGIDSALSAIWKARHLEAKELGGLGAKGMTALVAQGESLADFAKLCESKYKGKQVPTYTAADSPMHPKNACETARGWRAQLATLLPRLAAASAERETKRFEWLLEGIDTEGRLHDADVAMLTQPDKHVAEQRAAFEPIYQKLGVDMPADLFVGVEAAGKRYPEVLAKAAKVNRWPAGSKFHDGAAEKAISSAMKSGGSVVKVGLVAADWDIIKNDVDLPLRKIRTGHVAVKRKGDKFCRIYNITAAAEYSGGGSYAKPQASYDGNEVAIVTKCP